MRTLFLSGQIPLDPATGELVAGDVEAQTARVMENLRAVLAAGGAGFEHVVRTTIFLADLGDFARVNAVYGRYFPGEPPARATVQVAALPAARASRSTPSRSWTERRSARWPAAARRRSSAAGAVRTPLAGRSLAVLILGACGRHVPRDPEGTSFGERGAHAARRVRVPAFVVLPLRTEGAPVDVLGTAGARCTGWTGGAPPIATPPTARTSRSGGATSAPLRRSWPGSWKRRAGPRRSKRSSRMADGPPRSPRITAPPSASARTWTRSGATSCTLSGTRWTSSDRSARGSSGAPHPARWTSRCPAESR